MARVSSRKSSKRSSTKRRSSMKRRSTSSKRSAPMKRKVESFCSSSSSATSCKMTPGCSWRKAPGRKNKICVRAKGVAKGLKRAGAVRQAPSVDEMLGM
jgi:hypothetical protein